MITLTRASFIKFVLSLAIVFSGTLQDRCAEASFYFGRYAAIAYSTTTGDYGYAWDHSSLGSAKAAALNNCKAEDAEIVGWVCDGWLVLAIGEEYSYGVAWEYGDGATNTVAAARAKANLASYNERLTTLICLCSSGFDPEVFKAGSN